MGLFGGFSLFIWDAILLFVLTVILALGFCCVFSSLLFFASFELFLCCFLELLLTSYALFCFLLYFTILCSFLFRSRFFCLLVFGFRGFQLFVSASMAFWLFDIFRCVSFLACLVFLLLSLLLFVLFFYVSFAFRFWLLFCFVSFACSAFGF